MTQPREPITRDRNDCVVVADLLAVCEVTTTSDVAQLYCDAEPDTFDGTELIGILGLTAEDLPSLLVLLGPAPLAAGGVFRAVILQNRDGHFGVTLGYGLIAEPCGRQFALTPWDPTQWVSAYLSPTILYTTSQELP